MADKTVVTVEATKWSLKAKDWFKGLGIAVGTVIIKGAYDLLSTGAAISFEALQPSLMAGAAAGLAYILKNFAENSKGEILKSEPKP